MKRSTVLKGICLLVVSLFVFSPVLVFSAEESVPWDATVQLTATSVAAGVGLSWGSGVLMYHGKEFKFKVDGLSIGNVGIQNATALGKVYNLKNVADFAGDYAAVAVGMTVGGGAGTKTMRNEHGVIIDVVSTNQGVDFTLGPQGVKIILQ